MSIGTDQDQKSFGTTQQDFRSARALGRQALSAEDRPQDHDQLFHDTSLAIASRMKRGLADLKSFKL